MIASDASSVIYFKRYRMEIALVGRDLAARRPPEGYGFQAWSPALLDAFAEAKYLSFRGEIDANVFPCLGELDGCRRLMREIVRKPGFLPETTWLLSYRYGQRRPQFCGTVQGIRDVSALGAIQNLGVIPAHRGRGLGAALLLKALEGFRASGIGHAYLEVTAQNDGAVRLYRRLGFRCRKTIYKAVDAHAFPASAAAAQLALNGSYRR